MSRSSFIKRIGFLGLFLVGSLQAAIPQEAEFAAARITGEDVANWLDKLPNKPASIGIFSVTVNAPLDGNFSTVIENEVIKHVRERGGKIVSCPECRTPQVSVSDDRLVVTKGSPDLTTLKELAKKYGVDAFIVLDVYRPKLAVVTQVALYQPSDSDVVATDSFRVPAVNIGDTSMNIIVEAGIGFGLGGSRSYGGSSEVPMAFHLVALENLGTLKGGLTFGGVSSGGFLGYVIPTLGYRGRFGSSNLSYLATFGPGFGISGPGKGVALRAAFDVFLGSFALLGVEGSYLIPVAGRASISGFAGFHIGISFGS